MFKKHFVLMVACALVSIFARGAWADEADGIVVHDGVPTVVCADGKAAEGDRCPEADGIVVHDANGIVVHDGAPAGANEQDALDAEEANGIVVHDVSQDAA